MIINAHSVQSVKMFSNVIPDVSFCSQQITLVNTVSQLLDCYPALRECQKVSYLSTLCCKLNLHCSSVNFVVANSMKHSVIYIFFNFVYLVHFDRLDMNSSVLHTFI